LSVHPPLYFVMGVLRLENNLKKHTDAPWSVCPLRSFENKINGSYVE
jgi:hypothetical protein